MSCCLASVTSPILWGNGRKAPPSQAVGGRRRPQDAAAHWKGVSTAGYDRVMRVATWNVNSIRTRVGRVVDWMVREDVDVLAMQEIKCKPEQFPAQAFEDAGYDVAIHGLNQWN